MSIKPTIRSLIPEKTLLQYHRVKALLACKIFGNPTKDLFVIGITGTKGKSTTANFVWSVLQAGGIKTGLIGTANIRIGQTEKMNNFHMTMPSPMVMQKIFKEMKQEKCEALVMEVTSEGIKQSRHLGIDFDIGMFTNLSPEHLPSHNNSFEEYKKTKLKFFQNFSKSNKTIIVNSDDEHAESFLDIDGVKKIMTSLGTPPQSPSKRGESFPLLEGARGSWGISAKITSITENSTKFSVKNLDGENENYEIFIGGTKNVENALLAVALGKKLKISPEQIQQGFNSLKIIPGRMEKISISPKQNFSVFVDYAHEEKSMDFLMETGEKIINHKNVRADLRVCPKIIVLLGAEGGGRDKSKRAKMGKIVGQKADFVVVSNVDPYDDDPTQICEDIAISAEKFGKTRDENLFVIEDRKSGIEKCIGLANDGDIIFITGKGSEQSMIIGNKTIDWDDRNVVREILNFQF